MKVDTRKIQLNVSRSCLFPGMLCLMMVACGQARAQDGSFKGKSGESVDLLPVFRQVNCRGTLLETPVAELLQGPPEVTLSVRDAMVEVPNANCPAKVKGAIVSATIGSINEPLQGRIVFRVKYKGKYRESQTGHAFDYSLVP